jgi:hypothetical protein
VTEPQNIDEVILSIQQDPPVLVKDQDGQVGNQKTKYVNLNQVNEKVMPRLTAMSTIYVCTTDLLDDGRFALEYELKHVPSGTAKIGKYALALGNPQAMGSAITYARRYALLAALGIVAENEDDDGAGRGSAQRQAKRATPEQQGQVAQRRPSGPPLPAETGNLLTDGQLTKIQVLFREKGLLNPERKKAFMEDVVKRPLGSTKNLTRVEAVGVIDALEKLALQAGEPA